MRGSSSAEFKSNATRILDPEAQYTLLVNSFVISLTKRPLDSPERSWIILMVVDAASLVPCNRYVGRWDACGVIFIG